MRKPYFIPFLFITLVMLSCKNDIQLNDTWEETNIIYALLNKDDSVHYIRIEKAFLNTDESAYRIAQITDSLYTDSLLVELIELKNGSINRQIVLDKVYNTKKDSGIFAYPGQYLYRNRGKFKLDSTLTYMLRVKNPRTGYESTASTEILNEIKPGYPGPLINSINFRLGYKLPFYFSSGKNAKFYDLAIYIKYTEFEGTDTLGKSVDKELFWQIFKNRALSNTNGFHELRFDVPGDDFFNLMLNSLPINDQITRKLRGFRVNINGGGLDIYNYIQVYRPSLGIVQKKPEYTNINNGLGIFSSRSEWNRTVRPLDLTIDVLVNKEKYKPLNFVF